MQIVLVKIFTQLNKTNECNREYISQMFISALTMGQGFFYKRKWVLYHLPHKIDRGEELKFFMKRAGKSRTAITQKIFKKNRMTGSPEKWPGK